MQFLLPAVLAATMVAQASGVGVTINGQPVNLDPAPIMRAGRVFVPLRGVFERLGASVVYANGQINATGNGRNISLNIGSNQASINGQGQTLDVAPFIVGASTYVPLRFVAQALGDQVNWDNSNSIVAIQTNGAISQAPPPQQAPRPPQPQQPQRSPITLASTEPANGSTVSANRPTIEARFENAQADPNSMRVALDQLDITGQTSRSPRGIVFSPPSDLMPQRHVVDIRGNDRDGRPFNLRFGFNSGTQAAQTFLDVTSPQNGATVGSSFTVRGRTMPNARVTVEAGGSANVGGIMVVGTGTFRGDTVADANGNFAQDVQLTSVPGGSISLVVSATDPQSRAAAPQVQRRLNRG